MTYSLLSYAKNVTLHEFSSVYAHVSIAKLLQQKESNENNEKVNIFDEVESKNIEILNKHEEKTIKRSYN